MSDRGKCCSGDPDCALNRIVRKTDHIFKIYDRDRDRARELLDNILLELEEDVSLKQMTVHNLMKEMHKLRKP